MSRRGHFDGLFSDVKWTPELIGLLVYVFSVVTYRVPLAMPGMILALVGVLLRGSVRVPPFLWIFGAFLIWSLIGYTQSDYQGAVWERILLLGKLWLIGLVIVNALRTRAQVRFFAVFFLVCFATHPARGAIFNYVGGYTVFGRALWNHIYANPNDLAALTLFPLGLAIGLLKDVNIWVRRGALVSVVALIALILMTQSRGGFLALAVIAVMIALRLRTQRKRLQRIIAIVAIAATAIVIAPSGVWDRVAGLSEGTEADSSSRQRWLIWQVAREISADHRLLGVGVGTYPRAHDRYTAGNPEYAFSAGRRDTHSTYLNVLVEAGVPGLLLFLTMIAVPLVRARRALRSSGKNVDDTIFLAAVGIVLIGYLVSGIFATVPHLAFLYVHLAFLHVLIRMQPQQPLAARGRGISVPRRGAGMPAPRPGSSRYGIAS